MIAESINAALLESHAADSRAGGSTTCGRGACSRGRLERTALGVFYGVAAGLAVFSVGCFAYAAVGEARLQAGWAGEARAAARPASMNTTMYPPTTYPPTTFPTATYPTTTYPTTTASEPYTTTPGSSDEGEVAKTEQERPQVIEAVSIVSV